MAAAVVGLSLVAGLAVGSGLVGGGDEAPRTARAVAAADAGAAPTTTGQDGVQDGVQDGAQDGAQDEIGSAPVTAAPLVQEPLVQPPDLGVLPEGLDAADLAAGLTGTEVPEVATGALEVVPGSGAAGPDAGPGARVRTVRVEVEAGLAVDGATFAQFVMQTLADPRSWGGDGSTTFVRTDGAAELRVVLASPDLTDALCAPLDTGGQVSCGRAGAAVLNWRRWVLATPEFADRTVYRQYLVNHEVGHLLGHGHRTCPGAGQVAPVMQQQTLGVAPCTANAWPFPG
ncbi:Protein of unknown function [Cellulomonas marina]|uniref:DUF3152 domain-containing protein n=1 Tax=Cellulomonas marina TaxID=988821 RepID=A0A1I1A6F5_9CELL|nr:Protein of unknown function [Cellulomonas marina]